MNRKGEEVDCSVPAGHDRAGRVARAGRAVLSTVVGALAAVAMMMPMASAQAASPAAGQASQGADRSQATTQTASSQTWTAPVADTSADGVTRVAKTHAPEVETEKFTPVSASEAPAPSTTDGSSADAQGVTGSDGSNDSGSDAGGAAAPYSLAAEPRSGGAGGSDDSTDNRQDHPQSRSAAPRSGATDGQDSRATDVQPVTVSADLSGLATVGVTWKQQDMKDPDKAPTYQLRVFRDNAWSEWVTIPSVDDDFGRMGISPSYYVGDATKVEAQLTPAAGQTITSAKLVTVDSGYSAVGDAQTSAYRGTGTAATNDSDATDDIRGSSAVDSVSISSVAGSSEPGAARTQPAATSDSADAPAAAVSSHAVTSPVKERNRAARSSSTVGARSRSVASDSSDSSTVRSATQTRTAQSTGQPTVRQAAAVTATGRIHTREEWWVAGNPAMTWKPKRDGRWKGAIVHHTVDRNDYTQAEVPAMINGIYLFHNSQRGWGDIGYQLIVDRFGGIWEGRDEGVPNQVVPASQVEGAQSVGFNRDTFGVAMLGSYHLDVAPTDAQIESTAAAITWEFKALGITSPYGTFQFLGTQQRITGHGDASHYAGGELNRTLCPGQQVWNRMEEIRTRVLGYMIHPSGMPAVNVPNGTYYINSVAKDSSSIEIPTGASGTAGTTGSTTGTTGSSTASDAFSTADGVRTQLHSASGKANQQFTFTRQPDGSYEIRNVASGKVLDVSGARAVNNAVVQQWTPDNTAAQRWFIRDSGAGYYIQSALGDYVLDLSNGRTADGSIAALYSPNGSAAQKFGLASADVTVPIGKNVRIESALKANMVLDIYGGSTANGGALQLYGWNGTGAQQYRLKLVGNNVVEIANAKSNKVIDVPGNNTANGVKLQQYAANGSTAQHWMIRNAAGSTGSGSTGSSSTGSSGSGSGASATPLISFYGVASGKSFDLPGADNRAGTRVQLYTGNNTKAQQWKLIG